MLTEPKIIDRQEEHYAAIRTKVNMKDIPKDLPPLIPKVNDWLKKNKVKADGPPLFRYLSMDKDNMDVEVGVPVKNEVMGDGIILPDSLPAGRYASITYKGDYSGVKEAHKKLDSWIKEKGYKAKAGTATEIYVTDPEKEPSKDKWQTDVIYLLES